MLLVDKQNQSLTFGIKANSVYIIIKKAINILQFSILAKFRTSPQLLNY